METMNRERLAQHHQQMQQQSAVTASNNASVHQQQQKHHGCQQDQCLYDEAAVAAAAIQQEMLQQQQQSHSVNSKEILNPHTHTIHHSNSTAAITAATRLNSPHRQRQQQPQQQHQVLHELPYNDLLTDEELRKTAGQILNGIHREVEVQSVNQSVISTYQDVLLENGEFSQWVFKNKSGYNSLVLQYRKN